MSNTIDYPLNADVGELEVLIGKHQWLAIAVDLIREQHGEDISDEDLQAKLVARLDILHTAHLVPRTVPKRVRRSTQ